MKIFFRVIIFLTVCNTGLFAQETDSRVLLTVNGKDITAGEYMWLYEKNNARENSSSISEYLELYTLFRLKVEAAIDKGIDQTESFNSELNGYRKQLARSYLTDQEIKEELLQKAFERSKEEINAYHILIRCPADGSPADTLEAYSKALDIRERIRIGESFKSVARGASDDPKARFNGGNLGYLTVFQTPLNFEDVVYSMNPGKLSRPVRTSEGYHIIKVQDRRNNSGKVKVAHIMKACPPGSSEDELLRAKTVIDTIYKLVSTGSDFSELAKQYSDDKGSSAVGGELPWFGAGEMVFEFAEESFKLLRDGDYTLPFRTMYGWHIVKRIGKQAPLSYEEKRKVLESKMSHSYLESLSKKSFVDKLKEGYSFSIDRSKLRYFYSVADSTFRSGTYNWDTRNIPSGNIYSYADKALSTQEFAEFISLMGKRAFSDDSIKFINTLIDLKSYDDLVKYEDSILEDKYPEFGYLIKEFHDGILLFEISNMILWSKVSEDTAGFKEYWESRKTEFMTEESISGRIATISPDAGKSRKKKLNRELKKLIKSNSSDKELAAIGNAGNRSFVSAESGTFARGDNAIIDQAKRSRGISVISDGSGSHIVYISEVKDAEPLSFNDARSYLIDDYQAKLENEWHKQLRERYNVKINESVLNTLIEESR